MCKFFSICIKATPIYFNIIEKLLKLLFINVDSTKDG